MNDEIRFQCSNCEQRMAVDGTAVGLIIQCPNCGTEQKVPEISQNEAEPEIRPRSKTGPREPEQEQGSEFRQDLISASVKNSRLESQITEMREQLKKLRADLAQITQERNEALDMAQQLQPELDQTREALNGYQQTADSLAHQIREAESEVENARRLMTDAQEERTAAVRENQVLQQRAETLDAELTTARAELAGVAGKTTEFETTVSTLREDLTAQQRTTESQLTEIADLTRERDSLKRSLSESGIGQELVAVRDHLAAAEKEIKHLTTNSRQLTADLELAEKSRHERDELLRNIKTELDEARRAAAAASDAKMRNDNEVLRGIIERQNSELEQKHIQLVRLKRARLGVQFAYAGFALALAVIAYWAIKNLPALQLQKLLDF